MDTHRRKGHRLFAAFWERAVRAESARERATRREVVSAARGRILEVGVGVGANWRYLPDGADYTGTEPDAFMRERAQRFAAREQREIRLSDASAEALPFADESFDTVICTLVLCTVPNPDRALAEMRRVLRPGGELRFWEHIRPPAPAAGRAFDAITPLWKRLGGGCHPNRRTVESIVAAGFDISPPQRFRRAFIPMVSGVAVKPAREDGSGR